MRFSLGALSHGLYAQTRNQQVESAISMNDCIAAGDRTFEADRDHYFAVGRSALHCVKVAMLTAAIETFGDILDLPSGHGRVLRHLQAAFPKARLTASDIEIDAVDSCAKTFGATPIYSQKSPQDIRLPREYDLIWVGSLLPHLDKERCIEFLEFFRGALSPKGVLLFTMHGRTVAKRLREGGATYGLSAEDIPRVLRDYADRGFGYANYPKEIEVGISENYGVSLVSPRWLFAQLEAMKDVRLLNYTEHGWDNHHDVIACTHA